MSETFSFRTRLPQIVAVLAAIVIAFTAREFFKDPEVTTNSDHAFSGPLVGEIQTLEGQVLIRPPRGTRFEAAKPGPYRAESVLQTQAASAAVIEFRPGPTLRLLENSRLVTELDSSRDGAIQATILAGEVTVLSPGSNPLFTLVHNGVPIPLQEGAATDPMARTVPLIRIGPESGVIPGAGASADLEEKLEVEKESEMATTPSTDLDSINPQSSPTPSDGRPKTLPAKVVATDSSGLLRSTLTNDDIRTQVRSQAGSFQKCYVTMVNRMSESGRSAGALPKGETIVGFKILPTGKVEEHHVIRSPFKDATFDRCLAEAVGRLRFRQFQGAAIPVGEFPIVLE